MVRHLCILCGNMVEHSLAVRSSQSNADNAIMLSALKIYTSISQEILQTALATFQSKQKYICTRHPKSAAEYLLSEVEASGGRLYLTTENVAYLNVAEISPHIPWILNEATRSLSANITVNTYDVNQYINIYLRKYYNEGDWDFHHTYTAVQGEEHSDHEEVLVQGEEHFDFQEVVTEEQISSSPQPSQPAAAETPSKGEDSSPAKTSTGSIFTPGKLPSPSDEGDETIKPLKKTDPKMLDKFFLVQGKKLLELFYLTRCRCGCITEDEDVRLDKCGSAPFIQYRMGSQIKRWDGQERISENRNVKQYLGNALSMAAAVTTGIRMNRVKQWASEIGLTLPAKSAFYRFFNELRPAISMVYDNHHNKVMEKIRSSYEINGCPKPWDIAVDAAYDSRGFSAKICKVLAVDLKTDLCIHTEVVHSSETNDISGRMEKEGCHRLLRWFQARGIPLNSVSTDRSAVYGSEIREFNNEFGTNIKWMLDTWHLARRINNSLRTGAKAKNCESLKSWIDAIKTHLYYAVKEGATARNPELIREVFNTCLHHVAGEHQWTKNALTGLITRCDHDHGIAADKTPKPLIAIGSPAHNKLKDILLQAQFQKDLAKASPLGGTSRCESKNSLDRIYCPKDIYLPPSTYSSYVKLSTMHLNTLRLAEMRGERKIERTSITHRKFNKRPTNIHQKTRVAHLWRKQIFMTMVMRRTAPAPAQSTPREDEMDRT